MGMLMHKLDDENAEVVVWGRVARPPEMSFTKVNKVPKVTFSIAYGESQFMNCIAYNYSDIARISKALRKGDIVFVAGKRSTHNYINRDGLDKVWIETLVEFISVVSTPQESKKDVEDDEARYRPPENAPAFFDDFEGDLPF